ncbi:DUF4326 domain-containing protein [Antarcticimicrobium luteum]|uniref:DUF4326 domain-containing protein n=2 Tax=Antarcticimicrobium luteum TaxID=2547397 RepID=A0A4R5UXG6_9RHOB|nr:DUF4326 domain-containing protein [Antarcticimicrobium luteum]
MRRDRPWRAENPDAVIVARPSRWGNPFRIGEDGIQDAAAAVREFRALTEKELRHDPHLISFVVAPLRGRDLACWCRLCDRHAEGLPLGETCPD